MASRTGKGFVAGTLAVAVVVSTSCTDAERPSTATADLTRPLSSSAAPEADTAGGTAPRTAGRDQASIVGDLHRDSSAVPCAPGSSPVGDRTGYYRAAPLKIQLCVVLGLASTAPESRPGSKYYVPGADRHAVVNARVSGAVVTLQRTAAHLGLRLVANSAFRSMAHQRHLCRSDPGCRRGDHRLVAPPGWSNHQLGDAIDFAGPTATGGRTCAHRAVEPGNAVWRFLRSRAGAYGYRQYSAESWHWDAGRGPDRC